MFDLCVQQGRVILLRFKNNVSTLDISLYVDSPDRLEHPLQTFHFDDRVSAEVDCAEKGYIFIHHFYAVDFSQQVGKHI